MILVLIIFNACQKKELGVNQLTDESQLANEIQPQSVVNNDVSVERNYLVFNDYEAMFKLSDELNRKSSDFVRMGFKSAFSHRKDLLRHADFLQEHGTQEELLTYLTEVSKTGYFDFDSQEFVYPFNNERLAHVLNPQGEIKIGDTIFRFKGTTQTIKTSDGEEVTIELYEPITRGGDSGTERLFAEKMLALLGDRTLLQLKRERYTFNDRYEWEVYLRFYAYEQYLLYKSDVDTRFHFTINKVHIGGNNSYPLINNNNTYTYYLESVARSIIHFVLYRSYILPKENGRFTEPTVHEVYVSEFYSDFMPYCQGSSAANLHYTN